MDRRGDIEDAAPRSLRCVLILADESANWEIAGLRQLDRLALSLREFMRDSGEPLSVSIFWNPEVAAERRWMPNEARLPGLPLREFEPRRAPDDEQIDLIVSTQLLLFRGSLPRLLTDLPQVAPDALVSASSWEGYRSIFEDALSLATDIESSQPWRYLRNARDVSSSERAFLRHSGKSQDGLVSRYLNRPISRSVSRLLLKFPIAPNTWSVLVFALPVWAAALLLRGTSHYFFVACAIYQVYSILDGCDGEIARAKFLQTEFGRRLDSFLDLIGNLLLALCLGVGLARQWERGHASGWFYVAEGIAAACFVVLSEGIVFSRRSRAVSIPPPTRWNGMLYQRHHEFLERSGVLVFGERFAWWLVQMTKRDMAMLAFLFLAAVGFAECILHLLLIVSAVSVTLAGNAFLRQPAPALPQEAS